MKQWKKAMTLLLAVALMASCVTGCGSSSPKQSNEPASSNTTEAEKRVVRLAIQPSCAFIPFYIARENGWIEEAMEELGVDVVWSDFESGPPMNESFAAGQQDIGVIGDVPAVTAVANGQENVFIAAEEGGAFSAMLVMEDSGINSAADLKGKKIGVTIGSTGQNLTQKILESAGLDFYTDIEAINVSMGEAQMVLTNHNVDAVVVWEPNVSRIAAIDGVKILIDGSKVGFGGVNVVFARKAFVDENPDIVKAFLEQYWRATKAFEESPEDYSEKIAEIFHLDEELLLEASSKCIYPLQFTETATESLQDTVSFVLGIGGITDVISVKDYIADNIAKTVIQ